MPSGPGIGVNTAVYLLYSDFCLVTPITGLMGGQRALLRLTFGMMCCFSVILLGALSSTDFVLSLGNMSDKLCS